MNLPEGWTYHKETGYEYIGYISGTAAEESLVFWFNRVAITNDLTLNWLGMYLKYCNTHGFCYWAEASNMPEPMPEEITTMEQAFQYGYTLWRMG